MASHGKDDSLCIDVPPMGAILLYCPNDKTGAVKESKPRVKATEHAEKLSAKPAAAKKPASAKPAKSENADAQVKPAKKPAADKPAAKKAAVKKSGK